LRTLDFHSSEKKWGEKTNAIAKFKIQAPFWGKEAVYSAKLGM